MAAYQGVIGASPAGHFEPRKVARRGFGRLPFGVELHDAFGSAEAKAGHRVDDDAQPVDPAQLVVPAVRARTVKLGEKLLVPRSAQFRLDFPGERFRRGNVPLRQEPRVDQHVVCGDVHHRPVPQPVEQAIAVGRRDHVPERVVFAGLDRTLKRKVASEAGPRLTRSPTNHKVSFARSNPKAPSKACSSSKLP